MCRDNYFIWVGSLIARTESLAISENHCRPATSSVNYDWSMALHAHWAVGCLPDSGGRGAGVVAFETGGVFCGESICDTYIANDSRLLRSRSQVQFLPGAPISRRPPRADRVHFAGPALATDGRLDSAFFWLQSGSLVISNATGLWHLVQMVFVLPSGPVVRRNEFPWQFGQTGPSVSLPGNVGWCA